MTNYKVDKTAYDRSFIIVTMCLLNQLSLNISSAYIFSEGESRTNTITRFYTML